MKAGISLVSLPRHRHSARAMTQDYSEFKAIESWIIDLDNTLYHAETQLFTQIDVLMGRFISKHLNLGLVDAKKLQKSYLMSHGTTLRGLMDNLSLIHI